MLIGIRSDRALVGEDFHAIDQRHDPVCLVADQLRQRAVFLTHEVSRTAPHRECPKAGS